MAATLPLQLRSLPREGLRAAVDGLVDDLLAEGNGLIWATWSRSALDIQGRPGLQIVDVSGTGPIGLVFKEDVCFIGSPVQLERTAMRMRMLSDRMPAAPILIDDAELIYRANGHGASMAFLHQIAVSFDDRPVHLLCHETLPLWHAMQGFVEEPLA